MAYITFVVLAGFVMGMNIFEKKKKIETKCYEFFCFFFLFTGMQNQFSPEQLGVISSSALAYSICELIIYSLTLYISNISSTIKTLDLLAFSGYKFVTINLCLLVSIIFKRFGYYVTLFYTSISLCFFLVIIKSLILILKFAFCLTFQFSFQLRTLKAKILRDATATTASYDAYGNVQQSEVHADYSIGRKRKLYFLFLISFAQPILSFFLAWQLIPSKIAESTASL